MAEVSDYIIVQTPQVRIPAVVGEMSDPVNVGPFPAGGHTGSDAFIQLLFRGLRRSLAEVHLNGRRITHLVPHASAAESEWFATTVVVPGALLRRDKNLLEFIRVTGDDYWVANVICTFHQNA